MKKLVLVDVQQLFLSARSEHGVFAKVDYVKLKALFSSNPDDDVMLIAYVLGSPYHDDKKFTRFLKNNGYFVMKKVAQVDLTKNDEGRMTFKEGSWSTFMVLDSFSLITKYDEVHIVSGNGQFCRVVSLAHKLNKKAFVISFKSSLQDELAASADGVIILDKSYIYDPTAVLPKVISEVSNGRE